MDRDVTNRMKTPILRGLINIVQYINLKFLANHILDISVNDLVLKI